MNIFLLFLTTLLMIGYYVMYSPSQKLEHMEPETVIKLSDLRSVAECVIASQNAYMNSTEYDDPCVGYYNVVSDYICTNQSFSEMPCDGDNVPTYNYIITSSGVLDEELHASMLKVIETLYQDRGALGICKDCSATADKNSIPYLMTADLSGKREIHDSIATAADLKDGQLVYIMQYQIPSMYSYPELVGNEESCPENTIAVLRYGRWLCLNKNFQTGCQPGYVLNPETNECTQSLHNYCEELCQSMSCGDAQCICYDNGEVACRSTDSICPDGAEPLYDPETGETNCVVPTKSRGVSQCSEDTSFTYSNPKTTVGQTTRIKTVHCAPCLTPGKTCNTATGMYEYICVPDPSKAYSESCFADEGTPDDCSGTDQGIYFGFGSGSRTDGITKNSGADIALDDVLNTTDEYHDNKYHCKTCTYGVNQAESVPPFVIKCN